MDSDLPGQPPSLAWQPDEAEIAQLLGDCRRARSVRQAPANRAAWLAWSRRLLALVLAVVLCAVALAHMAGGPVNSLRDGCYCLLAMAAFIGLIGVGPMPRYRAHLVEVEADESGLSVQGNGMHQHLRWEQLREVRIHDRWAELHADQRGTIWVPNDRVLAPILHVAQRVAKQRSEHEAAVYARLEHGLSRAESVDDADRGLSVSV